MTYQRPELSVSLVDTRGRREDRGLRVVTVFLSTGSAQLWEDQAGGGVTGPRSRSSPVPSGTVWGPEDSSGARLSRGEAETVSRPPPRPTGRTHCPMAAES